MSRYIGTRIRTKSTMHRKLKLIRGLASGCAMLGLASYISWPGPAPDFVPSAYQTLPLMVESHDEEELNLTTCEQLELASTVTAKYSSYELTLVCQAVWGEARGCGKAERQLVAWCICNRVDATGASVEDVVKAPRQFHGWKSDCPIEDDIREDVTEVLEAWSRGEEALVYEPYATTSEYLYFSGDGTHNWFREAY